MKSTLSVFLMCAALAASYLSAVVAKPAFAQEVGMRGGTGIESPSVAPDGRVTFRLKAPEAKSVIVSGDFGDDVAMTKGDDGVWSVTVGPLPPEMYVYYFTMDGVRLLDPSNPRVKIGYVPSTTTSLLTVPTKEPAFYDVQDVPHGEIRSILYKSKSNDVIRQLTVYVPPGYDDHPDKRYPVLYLLHGYANDHFSWHRYGRANDILDNLLAQGKIKPFLVVMPLGYGGARVNGDDNGIPPKNAGQFGGDFSLYERDILEDIIPMIDKKYRTIADRKHRAIAGFSMGGGQATLFGLRNLDTFSQIGVMSAGIVAGFTQGPTTDLVASLGGDHRVETNKLIDLLWIACGKQDFAMEGAKTLSDALTKAGIDHTFVQTDGKHQWRVWRYYLYDFAQLIFR
jgi:enterochelin esterase-like enzyme